MNYDEIASLCGQLGYRDKLRLAQLLIQLARQEEENQHPQNRIENDSQAAPIAKNSPETIEYIIERLKKLKPTKKSSLLNSISAMFQFQGGISDEERKKIVFELQRLKYIQIDADNKVAFL